MRLLTLNIKLHLGNCVIAHNYKIKYNKSLSAIVSDSGTASQTFTAEKTSTIISFAYTGNNGASMSCTSTGETPTTIVDREINTRYMKAWTYKLLKGESTTVSAYRSGGSWSSAGIAIVVFN